jgi:signal peptide peptidase SppA
MRGTATVVPVVRLSGLIGMSAPFRPGLTLSSVAGALNRAFGIKPAPAVAIIVNSPGGSPVQSHLIYRRIRQLALEKEKHVITFVEDVAASGGYMLALAGDEVFVDPSSIVGSIGVVSQGFGFARLIDRVGIERRLYTSGDNKAILDPFKPEDPGDVEHLKALQSDVHGTFIELVKDRRGDRLADDPDLFTGLFWSGRRAVDLGLVDATGEVRGVMVDRYGKDVILRPIPAARGSLFRRNTPSIDGGGGLLGRFTARLADDLVDAAEARAMWSRYRL